MRSDRFFNSSGGSNPFDDWNERLDTDLIKSLRVGPSAGMDDIETAIALTELLKIDFECYGTDGTQRIRSDSDINLCLRAQGMILERLGIDFDLPWRDFATFRTYWIANEGHGSWQARRDMVEKYFGPLSAQLTFMEDQADAAMLAEPLTQHAKTGWPEVDIEIQELRRRFRSSRTPQDYRAVGTDSVGVLEALSRTVYDPAKHVREGEVALDTGKSKLRIERFVEDALSGSENKEVRALVRKAIDLAHRVKHSHNATRRDAGIAGDSAILLANILRRIDLEQ